MKKIVGIFIAALMALSLFACEAKTTKTRYANVPYSTTRVLRRTAKEGKDRMMGQEGTNEGEMNNGMNRQNRTQSRMNTNENKMNRRSAPRQATPRTGTTRPNMTTPNWGPFNPGYNDQNVPIGPYSAPLVYPYLTNPLYNSGRY